MNLLRDLGKKKDTSQGSRGQPFRFVTPLVLTNEYILGDRGICSLINSLQHF
jgi:hypothetical protein